jgi:hypothetical protein
VTVTWTGDDGVVHEPEPVDVDGKESRLRGYVDGRQSRVSMATMRARRRFAL